MPHLANILSATAFAAWNAIQLKHFIANLIAAIAFTVMAAILACALLLLLCYGLMHLLISYGLSAEMALLVAGLLIAVTVITCIAFAIHYMRKLRLAPEPLASIVSSVNDVANAFMDGVHTPSAQSDS